MYIVFDFETTGLKHTEEQVIEIAACRLDKDLKPVGNLHLMVSLDEGRSLPPIITDITGIVEEDLVNGMPQEQALEVLKNFIGTDIVVAQFASFDLSFLSKVLLPEQFICTRSMARMLRPTEYASLSNLIQLYNVENLNPHRAFADVEATVQVFGFMKKECEDAGIEYLNVLVDSKERPLKYVPENAVIEYMEY